MKLPLEHIERIREMGYTDIESRFLYIVAIHSGYFTLRQFLNFVGARRGPRSARFSRKVVRRGHVRLRDYLGTGGVFQLFSNTFYAQIEKDNLRDGHRHSFDLIRTRLLLLDFVLANQDLDYLETEQDKVNLFMEKLHIGKEFLPARIYDGPAGGPPTVRYFVDRFPLFLAPPLPGAPPVVTFSFVDSGPRAVRSLVTHLRAYQSLFRQLARFRFLYIAGKEVFFRRAEERFSALVKGPLETDESDDIVRYFEIRKKWDNHEYIVPETRDFEFLNQARRRFAGEPFEDLYRRWLRGVTNELELRREFSRHAPRNTVYFETYLVKHHRSPIEEQERNGVNVL
jgi:hypothetical protein